MIGLLAVVAYALIAAALYISNGFYHPVSLVCVIAALVLALVGIIVRFPASVDNFGRKYTLSALAGVVALEVVLVLIQGLSFLNSNYLLTGSAFIFFAILPGLYLTKIEARFDWRLPVILLVFSGLFALIVPKYNSSQAAREPTIDVWHGHQEACAYLLEGKNPYSETYENIYGNASLYSEENLINGRVRTFYYPPLSLYFAMPGYLLGDMRWSNLLAIIGMSILLVAAGRRLGLRAGHPAELGVLAVIYHPGIFFFLRQSWTEAYLAFAAALLIWAIVTNHRIFKPLALGLFVFTKQYALLWLPSLVASKRIGWRDLVIGLSCGALTLLPFAILDWQEFWYDNVTFHMRAPFRSDSLAIPAFVKQEFGFELPRITGFAVASITALLVIWRRRPTLSFMCLGGVAVYLSFFLFNKTAFYNYYWLQSVMLIFAVVVSLAEFPRVESKVTDDAPIGQIPSDSANASMIG